MLNLGLDIVTTAAILFIVAAGLLMVFGVMKIINFSHGAFLTVGGYASVIVAHAGLGWWWSVPCAIVIGFLLGMVVERFIVRPLYARPLDAILATWGLGIIVGQIITLIFGRGVQMVASPVDGAVPFLGVQYSAYRLILVGVAVLVALALGWLVNGTRLGLQTRAVIMNEALAFHDVLHGRRARGGGGLSHHAARECRSEHGGAVDRRRVHAGAGVGVVAG
jgi:branched-subunit amino acid ABC-type transport system permease component